MQSRRAVGKLGWFSLTGHGADARSRSPHKNGLRIKSLGLNRYAVFGGASIDRTTNGGSISL